MPDQSTEHTPATVDDLLARIARAISDPAKVLRRGDDYTEPVPAWSARAVSAVLRQWLEGRTLVDSDAYARLIQYRRDTLGLICPQGHHTRFVDLLGDPNGQGYTCVHCAARAGALLELREPDAYLRPDAPIWRGYRVEVSCGQVWDGTRHLRPRGARAYAAELVSAANHADRQAAEQQPEESHRD